MAVDAHHLLHSTGGCYDAAALGRYYVGGLGDVAAAMQPSCVGAPMVTGQDASESGVTFGGAQEAMMMAPCRKRKRDADGQQLLGVAAHLQQQQLVDVDRLVLQHVSTSSVVFGLIIRLTDAA